MTEPWENFGAPDEVSPASVSSVTGVPFFGQGGLASIPPEAKQSQQTLLDYFKNQFAQQRQIDPQNQAIINAAGGGPDSALGVGAQLGSDVLAGIGSGADTAAEGLDRLAPGARIGSTLYDIANSAPFEGAALEHGSLPIRPAIDNLVRGAEAPEAPTLGVHNADFQTALRAGDPISAESALMAAGQPVDDLARSQIKSAMDYYKNGGKEDTIWGNRAPPPPTAEEAAQTAANDKYEAAVAAGEPTHDAYNELLKAHGQEPLPERPDQVPDEPENPNPIARTGLDTVQHQQARLEEAFDNPQEVPPPTRREQIQQASEDLQNNASPGKTAFVQPFPDAEPDYYRLLYKTKDGKDVSGFYTYDQDTGQVQNLSIGDSNAGLKNSVGPAGVRDILRDLKEQHPDLTGVEGYRISGARKAAGQSPEDVAVPVRYRANTDGVEPPASMEGPEIPEEGSPEEAAALGKGAKPDNTGLSTGGASESSTASGGDGTPPVDPNDVISRITEALKGAGKDRAEQEGLYTEARKAKLKGLREKAAQTGGEEGFHAELSALKGELPKVKGANIRENFSTEEVNSLFDHVKNFNGLSLYEGIRGRTALAKLLDGEIPTNSEIAVLGKIFPADFVKELIKNSKDIGGQGELFRGSEVTSSGPIRELLPEPKVVDPDKFVVPKGQLDLFNQPEKGKPELKGQGELFSGAETHSGSPIRELKPEAKPVDPDKYVFDKNQADFFPETREPGQLRPIKTDKPTDGIKPPHEEKAGLLGGIAALSRSLMASVDLSAPFTQGAFLVGRKEFWKSFGPMFKAAWSEQGFNGVTKSIEELPTYPLMEKGKLALSDINDGLTAGEEAFVGAHLAEKIPLAGRLVRGSERAYTAFLNKLRADTFNSIATKFSDAGIDLSADENAKALKDLAGFVNNATGKGDLGRFAPAGNVLGTALFSPRLMASRVNLLNPAYYVKLDPLVRKQAVSSLLSMGGVALTVAGLAKMGGADVETDPRSSDFMKVKVGNTRYSLTGGFGPYLTLGARLLTNEKKDAQGNINTLGAKYGAPTRWDTVSDFFANKASPAASFFVDWAKGKDHDFQPFSLPKEALTHFIPLFLQDVYDVTQDKGLKGLPLAIPSLFGVQTQTYQPNQAKAKGASPAYEKFNNATPAAVPAPWENFKNEAPSTAPAWDSFK